MGEGGSRIVRVRGRQCARAGVRASGWEVCRRVHAESKEEGCGLPPPGRVRCPWC